MIDKPFGAKAHCTIDYAVTAMQFVAPTLFDLKGSARTLCYVFGVAAGGLTALTNQPLTLKPVIPFRVHGRTDTPFVPLLLLLPWALGAFKQRNARLYFTAFFATAFKNYLLTDYNSQND